MYNSIPKFKQSDSLVLVDKLTNPEAHAQLSFINSTSEIVSLTVYHESSPVSYVSRCSTLTLSFCTLTIFFQTHSFPFLNHGQIILDKFSIHQNTLINSLIKCYDLEDLNTYNSLIWSNVEIRASSFRNIHLDTEGGSLIFCGCTESDTISGCLFRNVTLSQLLSKLQSFSASSKLENSFIFDDEEGIYGESIIGLSDNTLSSFTCRNTSFYNCYHHKFDALRSHNEDYSRLEYTTRQTFSTTTSFTSCNFSNISASETGGAIFFSSSSGSLRVFDCIFTSCSSSDHGGGIACVNSVVCVLSGCIFTHCVSSSMLGGGAYLSSITSCSALRSCRFESCSAYRGGGADVESSNNTGSVCEGALAFGVASHCVFDRCYGTQSACGPGGLFLDQNAAVTLRSCFFSSCTTPGRGAALYFDNVETGQYGWDTWVYLTLFRNNTASGNIHGHDICMNAGSSSCPPLSSSPVDGYTYTLTNKSSRVVYHCTSPSNYSIHDHWLPYALPIVLASLSSDSASSTSASTCANDLRIPCRTISELLSVVGSFEKSCPVHIFLLDGMHLSDDVSVTINHTTHIRSRSSSVSAVMYQVVNAGFRISISTQSLTVESFTITLNASLTSPLLTITSTGTLTLNDMIFTSSTSLTHSSSILSIGSGTLNCSSSTHISNFTLRSSLVSSLITLL